MLTHHLVNDSIGPLSLRLGVEFGLLLVPLTYTADGIEAHSAAPLPKLSTSAFGQHLNKRTPMNMIGANFMFFQVC